jgi:hypothetical protein
MFEHIAPLFGRGYHELQPLFDAGLALKFREQRRP